MSLKQVIEDKDSKLGVAFDLFIQALILFSLVCFTIETLPNVSKETHRWLYYAEVATVAIFTVEYILRVYVADNRLLFIFSLYGLIDLVAILPFYISTGLDLRSIRVLRLFRVFRIFKLLRYTKAIDRFKRAFSSVKEELVLYLLATSLILYLSSVGIWYFERDAQPEQFASVFHCLWWSIVTLTTVGYGDVYPVTIGGKIFTTIILVAGLGVVAVPTGLLASALTEIKKEDDECVLDNSTEV